ncbi:MULTISPECIES: DUF2500 domain-containing protein [unclassified Paenibacillus]|uniref:DUF2500 domain-containing protein n=1 Tax=unclassified Paenibacillus TaxID=185978 RepID=UPI002F408462
MFPDSSFGSSFGGGFNAMFSIVPVLIGIVFVIVIVMLIFNAAKYFNNASSPKESVYARVVAKRTEVRSHSNHHNHMNDAGHMHTTHSSRTYYYITLEFENGQRKEYLDVKNLYGLVVEGDIGYALTQGEWIVAFERNNGSRDTQY